MEAAEGHVQNLGYDAAFPSLINIDGRPTYFMVLNDKGNLVKQYALVDVKKYSIVATGLTQKDTLATYRKLLRENGVNLSDKQEDLSKIYESALIEVKEIKYINMADETYVYITDKEGNVYKEKFADDETLVFISQGQQIEIYYDTNDDTAIRNIQSWKKVNNVKNE